MREQLYACEPTALMAYLEQMENASAAEIKLAASMFGEDDDEDPLEEELSPEGTATIHINGPLSMKGPSPLARLFGLSGTSYADIMAWFKGCKDRAEVKAVTLAFNSPGGAVDGVDLAWQAIAACDKPVTAENHGMMASAAYWLASACPTIRAMSPACMQGSIGVKIAAIDDSAEAKASGRKLITIISKESPNKDDDVASSAGRAELQRRADATYGVFRSRVAQGRGKTEAEVQANFGEGALLIASEAKRVGMVDEVRTSMRADMGAPAAPDNFSRKTPAGYLAAEHTPAAPAPGRKPMTIEELIASDPTAKAALDRMLAAAKAEARAEVFAAGAKVAPILASADYPQKLKDAGMQVLEGKMSVDAFQSSVTLFDALKEDIKQRAAAAETEELGDTPPQVTAPDAALLAKAAEYKIDVAQVEAYAKANGIDPTESLKAAIQAVEQKRKDEGYIGPAGDGR